MFRVVMIAVAALSLAACGQQKLPDQSVASHAFLEKTAKEPGVQKLPSGVMYKVVREGPANGLRPQLSDEVKVHYEGKLIDGKVFDSSYERGQPAAMPLRGLIPAWQEALVLMRPGDEWILYVPPEQGYGAEGAGGGEIPPNAALIFRIELIAVLEGPGRTALG
ncbi:FKBP-type peptidyl-prolyl cis-trans isomerase [Phenylobacterium sp. J367]|uniref:FKBP-type peptidyl-prolyl cis-trans isomerase n=1 Tax=Phenylobacterium sp. J367 TaxID=2898435 RepID=UPI002151A40B|nr:FKBP-type peptidyl-prolyl cis-trans isomerase [Phenylobacterium sp. J367]MCR5878319.1 FKBP-type peptidyl-prolyl cis-trans isomerase [Phenylobacterium sp. J367]